VVSSCGHHRSALHRVLQALPRAGHGIACLARRLVVERLARRGELGLRTLQLLLQRLRHANVLLLAALQLALQLLLLPLRFALGGLALLFGLTQRCLVLTQRGLLLALCLALRLLVLPMRFAHRLFLLLHRLAVRLLVLAHRLLVLALCLFLLALGFELCFAHRLFVLLHRLAVCLLVLALCLFLLALGFELCLAHRLFVLLHRLAVRLLALPHLMLARAFVLLFEGLARRLCLGQRLAQLLQLAFGLRELVLRRFDARRGAFDHLDGVLGDGLGSGDDGGEQTQDTAGKGAGEHEDLRGNERWRDDLTRRGAQHSSSSGTIRERAPFPGASLEPRAWWLVACGLTAVRLAPRRCEPSRRAWRAIEIADRERRTSTSHAAPTCEWGKACSSARYFRSMTSSRLTSTVPLSTAMPTLPPSRLGALPASTTSTPFNHHAARGSVVHEHDVVPDAGGEAALVVAREPFNPRTRRSTTMRRSPR
jgi:hypothetical protein